VHISSQTKILVLAGLPIVAIIASSGPADQLPTSSAAPLLDDLTGALNTATARLSTNAPGAQGANDEDPANLINEILGVVLFCLSLFCILLTSYRPGCQHGS
jgi:hypothetical protein